MANNRIRHYEIIERIGGGGASTVYKAYDPILNRFVAIVTLRDQLFNDHESAEAFLRGAKIQARLAHPNIVSVIDFGYDEGNKGAHIITQYIESEVTLSALIREERQLSYGRINRLFNPIASAIDHIHRAGIIHNDITPMNILIDTHDNPFIVDFGIAVSVDEIQDGHFSGGAIGYMSPERLTSPGKVTSASDIFSLGAILYEMTTGHRPFDAQTVKGIKLQTIFGPVLSPRRWRNDLPESAELVMLKALNPEPELRYRTATEMANSFIQATSGSPKRAKTQNVGRTLQKKSRKITSILFLAADPSDATRLRLGEEFREIQEKLKLARLRDRFRLELPLLSVRPADISQALLDAEPQVVHFSGHGTSTGALFFENQIGEAQRVEPDAMAALFQQFETYVDCVLLNACYSEIQAKAIAKHIKYVIGMNQAIGDKAAIAFAVGFYQGLGAGRTIEEAYKLGCVQIGLQGIPENLTPVLVMKEQQKA